MNDKELILFLWKLMSDLCTDGDMPSQEDFDKIAYEFRARKYLKPDEDLFDGTY